MTTNDMMTLRALLEKSSDHVANGGIQGSCAAGRTHTELPALWPGKLDTCPACIFKRLARDARP